MAKSYDACWGSVGGSSFKALYSVGHENIPGIPAADVLGKFKKASWRTIAPVGGS